MLSSISSLFNVGVSFLVGMVVMTFALVFFFSMFQGIYRTIYWHLGLVGVQATIARLPAIIKLYLTVTYALRHAELVRPSLLIDYHGYRLECVINYTTEHNDAMIIYIRTDNPTDRDRLRVLGISDLMLKLPNWGKSVGEQLSTLEGMSSSEQIIMAIINPDEIKRWGIIPMVIALSILYLPD